MSLLPVISKLLEKLVQKAINQYVLSSGLYGAAAYYGLTTNSGKRLLETAYNQCLRVATGCVPSTPLTKLYEVAGAPSLHTKITRQAGNLANIALRHSTPTPARTVLSARVPQRIRQDKTTWQQLAQETLPTQQFLPLPSRPPPWAKVENLTIHITDCSRDDPPHVRLSAALECLDKVSSLCAQSQSYEVWTDGSVTDEGTGGSGYLVIKVTDGQRSEVCSGSDPAGVVATSFTAEVTAAVAGLSAAEDLLTAGLTNTDGQPSLPDLILVTDSRSLTDSVAGDPYRMSPDTIPVFEAIKSISQLVTSIHLVWVSSHCGLFLNDKVDRLAAAGTQVPQGHVRLPVQATKTAVRKATRYPPPLLDTKKLGDLRTRKASCKLNQLMTGHCSLLNGYLHRIGAAHSPHCVFCPGVVEDAMHFLFDCPGRAQSRHSAALQSSSSVSQAVAESPYNIARFLQLEKLL
ncbi:uncharacterized protein LOC135816767 [Sycon ciliatum]|uniref:uncharacterized protein LOC135816767 n=1 Tax=Sycon ciliatum TaxID=27933 RepID=UPI0031F6181B